METPINDSIVEYLEYLIRNDEIREPAIVMNMKNYKKLEREHDRIYGSSGTIGFIREVPLIIDNELPKNINYFIIDYFKFKF